MTTLRIRICLLSKKCDATDDVSVAICNSTTSSKDPNKSNATDDDSKKTVSDVDTELISTIMKKKPHMNQRKISAINNDNDVVDTNMDRLTDQVLDLPREYRPIRLDQDQTISSMKSKLKTGDHKSTVINIPTLPEITDEIYVDNARADCMSANDEELTVSCVET